MADHQHPGGTVILVTDDGMGQAAPELRRTLIRNYLLLLLERPELPGAICFYGEGVKLVLAGSPVLNLLQQLEERGVILISCATCLNFYDSADKLAVGVIGGMHDIMEAQWRGTKVITL
jgi:hypothetical protein